MSYASDLDAALRYEKSPLASVPGSEVLTPEDLSALKGKQTKADYADQVRDAVRGREGLLPTLDEVKSLAQAGESTRGEYEHATRTITSFLQPHHAAGFVVLNAVLSPQTKWEEHSAGAMRLLRMWHERGEPTDTHKLTALLDDFHNVPNPETGARAYALLDGRKKQNSIAVLKNLDGILDRLGSIASEGRGKIVDFARAFVVDSGIPIDTHMAKLLTPKASEIGGIPNTVRETARGQGFASPSHRIAAAISQSGTVDLAAKLIETQKTLASRPSVYNAYKSLIATAAADLGWEPRQVQETVWTAVVAIAAARSLGVTPDQILNTIKHEDALHAWNVGSLLTTPEVTRELAGLGLSRRTIAAFKRAAAQRTPVTGPPVVGNPSAFEAAARRVGRARGKGAWTPVIESIRQRLRLKRGGDTVTDYAGELDTALRYAADSPWKQVAVAALDNPGQDLHLQVLADELADHPAVEAFRQWVSDGNWDGLKKVINPHKENGSKIGYGAETVHPHTDEVIDPTHNIRAYPSLVRRNPELASLPAFGRVPGNKKWERERWSERSGQFVKARKKADTATVVDEITAAPGGIANLIHAVVGAHHFAKTERPKTPRLSTTE